MSINKILDGNSSIVEAVKQVNPDVICLNPIIPSSFIDSGIASLYVKGEINGEVVSFNTGHGALSGGIGASASGGRVYLSSSSQSLANMHEALFIASSFRLPIVMGVVNRSLAAPVNIQAEHSDSMAQRDSGWIQVYSEDPQEVYDNIIQAFRIGENSDVKIPVMVCMDAFVTSNLMEMVTVESDDEVKEFIGPFNPLYSLLESSTPRTIGPFVNSDYYLEFKMDQSTGISNSKKIIREVGKEFGNRFGRYYGNFESYKTDDADFVYILMNSSAGIAKEAVDVLRAKGEKVGSIKVRVFRPFPASELREALSGIKSIAVLDRTMPQGSVGGPLFQELSSAIYDLNDRPSAFPYIYGIGGKDIHVNHFLNIFNDLKEYLLTGIESGAAKIIGINE